MIKAIIGLLGLLGALIGLHKIKDLIIGWNVDKLKKQSDTLSTIIENRQGKIDELKKQYEKDIKDYEEGIDSSINPNDTNH